MGKKPFKHRGHRGTLGNTEWHILLRRESEERNSRFLTGLSARFGMTTVILTGGFEESRGFSDERLYDRATLRRSVRADDSADAGPRAIAERAGEARPRPHVYLERPDISGRCRC